MVSSEAVLVGLGLGFSLAAPPGPVLAKIAFDAGRGRLLSAFMVGMGATAADMTLFLGVYFGLLRTTPDPRLLGVLALVGVVLMNYFAYSAWQAARRQFEPKDHSVAGFPGGFLLAMASPFNWAWWVTTGAPSLAKYGLGLVIGFFPALLATLAVAIGVFALGARYVQGFERGVSYASAVLLWLFSVFLAYDAISVLT